LHCAGIFRISLELNTYFAAFIVSGISAFIWTGGQTARWTGVIKDINFMGSETLPSAPASDPDQGYIHRGRFKLFLKLIVGIDE